MVSCIGCSGGPPSNFEWTGWIETFTPSQSYYLTQGNGVVDFQLYSNASNRAIWFNFSKQTSQGTLQVTLTLTNGSTVFNQSTDQPFGSISGTYTNY